MLEIIHKQFILKNKFRAALFLDEVFLFLILKDDGVFFNHE